MNITLSPAKQGQGVMFYQAFYPNIAPVTCPASQVIGLKVNEADNLEGATVNLIINHKLANEQPLSDIINDPNIFITVERTCNVWPGSRR